MNRRSFLKKSAVAVAGLMAGLPFVNKVVAEPIAAVTPSYDLKDCKVLVNGVEVVGFADDDCINCQSEGGE